MAVDLFSIGKFTVHGYGLMIGLGFLFAVLLASRKAKQKGFSADHLMNIAMWVLVIGFLGGKLLFVIVNFSSFLKNPLNALGSEGFVVYGGVITGVLSIFVYSRIKKIDSLEYLDLIGVYVPLCQAFGRIGCFCAGCCYGKRTDSVLGVVFPEGCFAPAGVKVYPTQLFMAAGDFIIFLILLYYYNKKRKKAGAAAAIYLVLYSFGRFLIEFIRDDDRGNVGFLSTSQFIAIFIALFGIALLYYINNYLPVADKKTDEEADKTVEDCGEAIEGVNVEVAEDADSGKAEEECEGTAEGTTEGTDSVQN